MAETNAGGDERSAPVSRVLIGAFAALLIAALVGFGLWNALGFWPVVVDDSYISLRYARSIAEGLGPVYNPGERVEGYSNPTWTALMALTLLAGAEGLWASKVMGLVAYGVLLLGAVGLSRELSGPRGLAGWAAGVACCGFLAVSLPMTWWPLTGMEATFYAAMIIVSFWRLLVELRQLKGDGAAPTPVSAVLLGLASVTRPEAPLLLLGMVLARMLGGLKGLKQWLMIFAVPTVGYLAFRLLYFGFLFPNTYYEKRDDGGDELIKTEQALEYLAPWLTYEWIMAAGCAVGLVAATALWGRRVWPLVMAVAAQLLFILWKGYDWMPNQRFLMPILALMVACLAAAAAVGAERLAQRAPSKRWWPAIIALALVALQARTSLQNSVVKNKAKAGADELLLIERKDHQWFPQSLTAGWSELDRVTVWALARIPPGASVAYTEIGHIGWSADYLITDLAGLTDKEMSGSTARGPKQKLYYLKKRKIDWFIIKKGSAQMLKLLREEPWLKSAYDWELGSNDALVARRKGAERATPEQALASFAEAVERSPSNVRVRWHWMQWAAALAAHPSELDGMCDDFARDFPLSQEYIDRCEAVVVMGRELPATGPVPYKKR